MKTWTRKKDNKQRLHRGFTLTEMLLVVSLTSVIGLALYQALANGLNIWERNKQFVHDEDVAIALDKMSRDLQNTLTYSLLEFKGDESQLTFPTVVRVLSPMINPDGSRDYIYQIGKVEYSFDQLESGLFRRQANYGQAVNNRFDQKRQLTHSIRSARFLYHYLTSGSLSVKQRTDGRIPFAVEIEIELLEPMGGTRKITRLIKIPIGHETEIFTF